MPKVSVIIPVYQSAHTITEAIDSVLNQTIKDFEIIVIDDGSTDLLEDVLARYGKNIQLIKQKNAGVAASRNNGIENSSGEYVAFLDADDIWLPDKLAKQLDIFDRMPQLGVVYGNVYFWDGLNFQRKTYFDLISPHRGNVLFPLFAVNFIPLLSVIIRRSVLDEIGLFNETVRFVEDYEFLLRAALAWEFDYIAEPVGGYRISDQQVSKNFTQVADSLLKMKEIFYFGHLKVFQTADQKTINRGLLNKYFRLALWHLRDHNSMEAKSVIDRYFDVGGFSPVYLILRIFCLLPDPLRAGIIHLWEKYHHRPEFGLY